MNKDFSQVVSTGHVISDQCQITGKYRSSAHWSCNVYLKLTKKVCVIFRNLRGYDSYLIMQEIGNFDVKVNVLENTWVLQLRRI